MSSATLPSLSSPLYFALQNTQTQRRFWFELMLEIVTPVLRAGAAGEMKARLPFRGRIDAAPKQYTLLEAGGRLLSGIATWLAAENLPEEERESQSRLRQWTLEMIAHATDPNDPDCWNFSNGDQALVDAAYLAHAVIRAPGLFRDSLPPQVKKNLIAALKSSRIITPHFNNWLLFSAMVETALLILGEKPKRMRVDYAIRQFQRWYCGDGFYSDGIELHMDYYNSFVIHPMMVDAAEIFTEHFHRYEHLLPHLRLRAQRYAAVLERSISPEGTFPTVGRSITYRFGTMYALAYAACKKLLPDKITAGQTRSALTAVIERFAAAPGFMDENGFLQVGFCGHQPEMGEFYISGSSTYLCVNTLMPLGLPMSDPFWSEPTQEWTNRRLWSGQSLPADHALGHYLKGFPSHRFEAKYQRLLWKITR